MAMTVERVSLRDYCEEASSLIQSGEPEEAIRITRHILCHYPRHVASYRLLGQALLAAGNFREAIRQFRRVLSADPEDVPSRVGLAGAYEATGDRDRAIRQLRRGAELSPSDSDLHTHLNELLYTDQVNETTDQVEITRVALGHIHVRRGLHAKAVQEFRSVLERDPKRVDVQSALAEALWRAGRRSEAAEVCHQILERLPNSLKANLIIGAWWLEKEQSKQAEPHLRLAQTLDPENILAQALLGPETPLPPVTVEIERLDKDETESMQHRHPPTPSAEIVSAAQLSEPTTDWKSELYEEEAAPMSDEERSEEEFEEPLPDWLEGLGDDLLEDQPGQPAASIPSDADSEAGDETPEWLRKLVERTEEPAASEESPPSEPGDVPDWLQELRPEAAEEPAADSGTPDWLSSISAGQPPDDVSPEPTSGPVESPPIPTYEESDQTPQAPEAAEPAPEADEGRAMWEEILSEEGIDLESVEEVLPPEAAGMSAEEWLRSTADLGAGPPTASAEPEAEPPLVEEPEAPTLPVAEAAAEKSDIPDWLTDIQEPEPEPTTDAEMVSPPVPEGEKEPSLLEPVTDIVEESDVPDWLRDISAGEPVPAEEPELAEVGAEAQPEVEVDEAGLPDWLQDFEEPEAEAEPALEEAPAETVDWLQDSEEPILEEAPAETADWLQDLEELPTEALEAEIEPALEEAPDEPIAEAEEGRALWEQILSEEGIELESVEEAPPSEAARMSAEEWRRSTADLEGEPAAEQPVTDEEAEAPTLPVAEADDEEITLDWLEEIEQPIEEELQPEADLEVEAEPVEVDTPDWLRPVADGEPVFAEDDGSVAAASEAGEPDWLREIKEPATTEAEVTADQQVAEAADEVEEEIPEVEIDESGLPDWLREQAPEMAEGVEREAEPAAEMPEWLTDLESEGTLLTESDFEEPIELETGEMPEWLGEVMAGETTLSEEWTAEADVTVPSEPEAEEEQVPSWLQEFREGEREAAAEPDAEAAEPAAQPAFEGEPEPAAQPELPNWLVELREGVSEAEPSAPTEPSEGEVEAALPEAPIEVEATIPGEVPEPEAIQPEMVGPAWLGDLVRAEESLTDLEAIEEEVAPIETAAPTIEEEVIPAAAAPSLEEPVEVPEAEVTPPAPAEVEPVLVEAEVPTPPPEPLITRELEALRVEDLPKDSSARLSMARAALSAGDWSEALIIFETLVNSSEQLDSVIENLEVGVRDHPDDPAGYQLLGDACMKDGRLHDALVAYRDALTRL